MACCKEFVGLAFLAGKMNGLSGFFNHGGGSPWDSARAARSVARSRLFLVAASANFPAGARVVIQVSHGGDDAPASLAAQIVGAVDTLEFGAIEGKATGAGEPPGLGWALVVESAQGMVGAVTRGVDPRPVVRPVVRVIFIQVVNGQIDAEGRVVFVAEAVVQVRDKRLAAEVAGLAPEEIVGELAEQVEFNAEGFAH
jgi:hypothetical protein